MNKTIHLLLLLLIPLSSFSQSKKFSYIKFGEQGGFTGGGVEYSINANRQLYKTIAPNGKPILLGKISEQKMKEVLNKSNSYCSFDSILKKGNYNRYIEIKALNCSKKLTWGKTSLPANNKLIVFYDSLISIVNNKQYK